jgi:hypothetical protein
MQAERFECRVFSGWRRATLALPVVESLRYSTGLSSDMMTSPAWFTSRTAAWHNSPVVVLLEQEGKPAAAVLFYSRCHLGLPTGVVKGGNHTGDGLVIAPEGQRVAAVEAAALEVLLLPWVHTVAASLREKAVPTPAAIFPHADQVWQSRAINTHLSLEDGFEGFLSRLRPRSRRNYRYFRRRAEREHGLAFVPRLQVEDSIRAVEELRGSLLHPVPRGRSIMLDAAIRKTPGSFAMGIRDAAGRWMSYLSGWRQIGTTFVEWQLNCHDFEAASLSTVMRTYFLEHEAAQGVSQVVFVGGTSAALGRYCALDHCLDLVATRRGIRGIMARSLLSRLRPEGQVALLMQGQGQPLSVGA